MTAKAGTGSISIREVDFPELEADWRAVEEEGHVPTLFQTYDWVECWWRHYSHRGQRCLLAVHESSRLIAIAPLFIEQVRFLGIPVLHLLQPMGKPQSDYQAFVLVSGYESVALDAIFAHLKALQWDYGRLSELRQDTSTYAHLFDRLFHNGFHYRTIAQEPCAFIALPADMATYRSTLSKKTRQNMRYYDARLCAAGRVQLQHIERAEDLAPALEDFFALHLARWKEKGEASSLTDVDMHFHRDVTLRLSRYLELYCLLFNGKRIACQYAYGYRQVFYNYLLGWAPEFVEYGLGNLLTMRLIEDIIERGYKEYDFLRGAEGYKAHFSKTHRENIECIFSASKAKLSLWFVLKRLRAALRRR